MAGIIKSSTKHERVLAQMVAISRDWHLLTGCVAWIDSAGKRCKRTVEAGWLCKRHISVAERKLAKALEKEKAFRARAAASRAERLPKWKAELARVEKEIARRDPSPPTIDRAAYGGVGCSATARYQRNLFRDSNVEAMGRLVRRRGELVKMIGDDW